MNLSWLRDAGVNGIMNLRMNVEEEVWTKYICERIHEVGKVALKDGLNDTEMGKIYEDEGMSEKREFFRRQ